LKIPWRLLLPDIPQSMKFSRVPSVRTCIAPVLDFISRNQFRGQGLIRIRREAQPQPAFHRVELAFELDLRKFDFVPVASRPSRRFIAETAMRAKAFPNECALASRVIQRGLRAAVA